MTHRYDIVDKLKAENTNIDRAVREWKVKKDSSVRIDDTQGGNFKIYTRSGHFLVHVYHLEVQVYAKILIEMYLATRFYVPLALSKH